MSGHPLTRLFAPKTIAVIGGRVAESVIGELRKLGFAGEIWPVNPRRDEMNGIVCFPDLASLPAVPDAAYLGVERETAIALTGELAAMGAGGAIIHASGFAETGNDLTQALLEAAGDMPVLGPNCWGLLNLIDNVALWPDYHGGIAVKRGIGIISQSGNIAINMTMQQRGLPLGILVTLGNQTMVTANDCIAYFLENDDITAIGLHIEGIDDIVRFSELAIKAQTIGKPIIVLKLGASEQGAATAISHTATLAGADDFYQALFERFGIARLHSLPAFLETLKLLHVTGPLPGNRLASLSCSGGEAALIADRSAMRNVVFPPLMPDHAQAIAATLSDLVAIANPLDYHTFIWGDFEAMRATYAAVMQGGFDLTCLIIDYPRTDRCTFEDYNIALKAWQAAAADTGARCAVITTLPETFPETLSLDLVKNGIVPLLGIEEALDAIEAAVTVNRRLPYPTILKAPKTPIGKSVLLNEVESKEMLAAAGLPVPRYSVRRPENAAAATGEIGFPVVLKAIGLAHKTERDGVRLNLNGACAVEKAAKDLATLSDRVLIEEMVTDAVCELIVGVKRDAQFGLALVIGAGGILTELMDDKTLLLLPASRRDIETSLSKLKISRLIDGFRGKSGDRLGVINTIAYLADFAQTHWDTLEEMDINPLLVRPPGNGTMIADALIRLKRKEEELDVDG